MAKPQQHRWTLAWTGIVGFILVCGGLITTLYAANVSERSVPNSGIVNLSRWAPVAVMFMVSCFHFFCALTQNASMYKLLGLTEIAAGVCAILTFNLALNLCGFPSATFLIAEPLVPPVNCTGEIYFTDSPCAIPLITLTGSFILIATHWLNMYAAFKTPAELRGENDIDFRF